MSHDAAEYSPGTMDVLLAQMPPNGRVLDLGCGRGSFSYVAFPHLAIEALDEFPAPEAGHFPAHVAYRQGRAEALPYDAASFDLVIANFVMEHVSDFAAAIDEIARTLKPGGHFYMSVPDFRSFEDALYRALYAGGGHLQRHTLESVLATVYARTPLKLISYVEWPAGYTFLGDSEALRALVAQIGMACQEALGIDIRARSNYLMVFQAQQGLGRKCYRAGCAYCGSGTQDDIAIGQEWTCPSCGRINRAYPKGEATNARLEAEVRELWTRYPFLRPTWLDQPNSPPATSEAQEPAATPVIAATPAEVDPGLSPNPPRGVARRIARRLGRATRVLVTGRP